MQGKTKFFITLLFFFIFTQKSYSLSFSENNLDNYKCNNSNPEFFFKEKKIKNIEIRTDNPRRWASNALKLMIEFNSNDTKTSHSDWFLFNIDKKYKIKHKAKLKVLFEEKNTFCTFLAEIRITGDLWWHLDWKDGSIFTSLHVKLLNGNINNITQFKLLLPKSREGGKNEVFVANFFKELGFLSPKTSLVNAKFNGKNYKYIFQEDLRKEFLEKSGLMEGPILEGDERFTVDLYKKDQLTEELSLARISNSRYALKNETKLETAITAVSELNYIYLQHHQSEIPKKALYKPKDILNINTEKFFKGGKEKNNYQSYVALIYALDAQHNLSYDDSRFYYDPIEKLFFPIYYDGKSNIINEKQKLSIDKLLDSVSQDAKYGSINSIELVNNIDKKKFLERLNNSGLSINDKELNDILDKVTKRLETISISEPIEVKYFEPNDYFSNLEVKNDLSKNMKIVFVQFSNKTIKICDFKLTNCKTLKPDILDFNILTKDAISQQFSSFSKDNEKYLYVYNDINYNIDANKIAEFNTLNIKNDFLIKFNSEIDLNVDEENRKLYINQKNEKGRVILTEGNINSWKIYFKGFEEIYNKKISKDYLNLTGCITLLDVKVNDLKIYANNSSCEDAINLIRVKGSIDLFEINNSYSDGLDIDFSDVNINTIKIKNSRNDCLDLSFGSYNILNTIVNQCGDKGISVGEKSTVNLENIEIKNSNTGLVSKDSSKVLVKNTSIDNSKYCFAAYKKKQEFFGGFIKAENFECKNFYEKVDMDQVSKIIKNNIISKNNSIYKDNEYKIKSEKNLLKDYKATNKDNTINVVVEISSGDKDKWEVSKIDGTLVRDFYMGKPRSVDYLPYPINYGMIPRTAFSLDLGGDGDPLDVIILGDPIEKATVSKAKVIGIMRMIDLGERDDKIIALPMNKKFSKINNLKDLENENPEVLNEIKDWFENYKGKHIVKFLGFGSQNEANNLINLTAKHFDRYGIRPR